MGKEYTGHITGKHYLAMKKNDIGSFVVLWMNLECVIQRELNQKKTQQILYIITYIWNLEKWHQ